MRRLFYDRAARLGDLSVSRPHPRKRRVARSDGEGIHQLLEGAAGPSRRQNYSSVVFSVNCSMSPKMPPQVELTAIRADVTFFTTRRETRMRSGEVVSHYRGLGSGSPS